MPKGLTVAFAFAVLTTLGGLIWNASSVNSTVMINARAAAEHAVFKKIHHRFDLSNQRLEIMVERLLENRGIKLPPKVNVSDEDN